MCWEQTMTWDGPNGPDQITHVVEKFCAFCIAFPYNWHDHFPEVVAHENVDAADDVLGQIRERDICAAKRLGARGASNSDWEDLRNSQSVLEGLQATNNGWNLFRLGEDAWHETRQTIKDTLEASLQVHGIGLGNATKLLWIKRPRLIPICDSFVLQRLEIGTGGELDRGMDCIDLIRAIGTAHLDVLESARDHATARLNEGNPYRYLPEVRILDAVIWFDTSFRRGHWPLLGWHA